MQFRGPFDPATGAAGDGTIPWTNGDPANGTEGSIPSAEAFNDPQAEICAAIDGLLGDGTPGSGQQEGDLTQLLQAIRKAVSIAAAPGDLKMRAGSTVPDGWLECDGTEVSRADYPDLFAAIGTTYGAGDGAATFNLPDMRGEFPRGWDHGRGIDAGRALGSNQAQEIQRHGHTMSTKLRATYDDTGGGFGYGQDSPNADGPAVTINDYIGAADETRPRNVALQFVIKT